MGTVLSVVVVASGVFLTRTHDERPASGSRAPDDWSVCPEDPIYDRSLDFVDEQGSSSPAAAVRSVVPDDVSIDSVDVAASGRTADVTVSRGEEIGVFHLGRRRTGWLVRGGEGCAAWYAGGKVLGRLPDCETELSCITIDADE